MQQFAEHDLCLSDSHSAEKATVYPGYGAPFISRLRDCSGLLQDKKLARELQCLFASPYLRVNTTTDVTGVEICGALKNVLALAAGELTSLHPCVSDEERTALICYMYKPHRRFTVQMPP